MSVVPDNFCCVLLLCRVKSMSATSCCMTLAPSQAHAHYQAQQTRQQHCRTNPLLLVLLAAPASPAA
jgi:hypothetical protein